MSYASSYANKPPNAKGIGLTIGVHALIIAGVAALPAITAEIPFEGVIKTFDVEPDSKPIEPKTQPDEPKVKLPRTAERSTVKPMVAPPQFRDPPPSPYADLGEGINFAGSGEGIDIRIEPVEISPIVEPVIVEPSINTRFAANFQPNYPSGLLRVEEEGTVSVRVLVGINGKVKQIELVSTPHDGFWTATKRHAVKKWRFNPATRDGKPYESWMALKVKFEINS